jgi:dynein heavy chain
VNPEALIDNHKFSKSGIYYQPAAFAKADFIKYI